MLGSPGGWLAITSIALSAIVSLDILFYKRRPVSAVLWLAIVWTFPWWGPLAYGVFGIDRVRWPGLFQDHGRALDGRSRDDEGTPGAEGPLARLTSADGKIPDLPADHPGSHVLRVTEPAVRGWRVRSGNFAELLVDGDEFYPALLAAIENCDHSVHVQSYLIAKDGSGKELLRALENQARQGRQARLLYDRFGSAFAYASGLFHSARAAGVEVRATRTWGRVNLRNHRKVAIVDGRTAFVGGMNIDDRNTSNGGSGAADRDYQIKLHGPVVRDLQRLFLMDWSDAARIPIETMDVRQLFPRVEAVGEALAQVVPGGPDPLGTGLAKVYFGAIASARASVTVATPYFLPDDPIFEALRFSALRGVDVRVVVPERSNHWYTTYAARALYAPLLRAGVRIFERRAPFMHAKALVVDGAYVLVGSANVDYRSLYLNFELNVEVSDKSFAEVVERQLATEIWMSREVDLDTHERRSLRTRLTENLCRLFQPVL